MTDRLELTLINEHPEIARVHEELEKFAALHGFTGRQLHDVQLALEEHLTNIVNYAYEDQPKRHITVRIALQRSELRIEVEDDGRPFNPLEHPAPDLSLPID